MRVTDNALARRWYPVVDDTIGGWAISVVDKRDVDFSEHQFEDDDPAFELALRRYARTEAAR